MALGKLQHCLPARVGIATGDGKDFAGEVRAVVLWSTGQKFGHVRILLTQVGLQKVCRMRRDDYLRVCGFPWAGGTEPEEMLEGKDF